MDIYGLADLFKMTEEEVTKDVSTQTDKFVKHQPPTTTITNLCQLPDTKRWMSKCQCPHHLAVDRFCTLRNLNLRYATDRLKTFHRLHWNQVSKVSKAADLAEAGFWYTGEADLVRCFHCNVAILNWEEKDDPVFEHIKHSRFCGLTLGHRSAVNIPIVKDPFLDYFPQEGFDVVD